MPARTARPPRERTASSVVEAALLHDLAVVPALARALPVGGLPRAGGLAEHCYVLCEALGHEIEYRSRMEHPSHFEPAPIGSTGPVTASERTETAAALERVLSRLDRLYSAERPGGLDHIDDHLASLQRAAKAYFKSARPGNPPPGAEIDDSWWQGMGLRQRARIVAWAITALEDRDQSILRSQPGAVRILVRLYYRSQAQRRRHGIGA